jgi:hypothetical protein
VKVKYLVIGAGILLLLAAVGMGVQRLVGRSAAPQGHVGEPVLAAIDLDKAATIELVGPDKKTTLVATPGGWVVREQENFPADQGKLSGFLFKLNSEKLADKVTDNPDRLADLGLLTAEENNNKLEQHKTGIAFSVRDGSGKPLFELLIGKDRQPGSTSSAYGGQYVRFPAEKSAYLIGSTLFAETDPKEWIHKPILGADANKQFKRIRVLPAGGDKPLVFERAQPDAPWQLEGASARSLNTKEIENLAKRISDLEIVQIAKPDVQPAALGRAKLGVVEAATFDGRSYRFEIGSEKGPDSYRYLSVHAALAAGVTDEGLKKAVADFNTRYQNRVMAVYDWDAARLLKGRKEYLELPKPPSGESKSAAEPRRNRK